MSDTWRDRLKKALEASDMDAAELVRRAGYPPSNKSAWKDMIDYGKDPSIEKLARFTHALGKSLDEIYYGIETDELQLTITGTVSGVDMWEDVPDKDHRSVSVRMLAADHVSIVVDTADLDPNYKRGDVLSGPKMSGKHLSNIVGKDCFLMLPNGERHIRTIEASPKPNHYTLLGIKGGKPLFDKKIDWAAPIQMIWRG